MDQKPKVLVTGAAGFIGSHTVVELIAAGFEPVLIDNFDNSYPFVIDRLREITDTDLTFYEADCNSYHDLEALFSKEKNISGIIHFAANKAVGESVANPIKYYKNNVGSMIKIIEATREQGIDTLVFSSSCTVYGEPDHLPVNEDSAVQVASSPYGNTKQICEEMLKESVEAYQDFKVVSLRYFNPVGAHPSSKIGELPIGTPNNLIPFITQSAAKLRGPLTVFGDTYNTSDGSCIRDFIHVVDLAKAHVQALTFASQKTQKSFYEVFNIGTGQGNSVLEVIKSFEKITGVKVDYTIGPKRAGDVEKIYAEVTKSKNSLNWQTELSLEQSLLDAWNWQLAIKDQLNELTN